MNSYSQSIEWTEFDGTHSVISSGRCTSYKESLDAALQPAKRMGWTQPKWWQWWRWNDTRISEET